MLYQLLFDHIIEALSSRCQIEGISINLTQFKILSNQVQVQVEKFVDVRVISYRGAKDFVLFSPNVSCRKARGYAFIDLTIFIRLSHVGESDHSRLSE